MFSLVWKAPSPALGCFDLGAGAVLMAFLCEGKALGKSTGQLLPALLVS